MKIASFAIGLVGAALIVVGVYMTWKAKSSHPRYQQEGMSFTAPPSLHRYIDDQRNANGAVLVGAALQVVALILSWLAN